MISHAVKYRNCFITFHWFFLSVLLSWDFYPRPFFCVKIVVIGWFLCVCVCEMHQIPIMRTTLASYSDDKLLFVCFYTPTPLRGGGYTVLPPSVLPSKIFFVALFPVIVDGRNLIFGHKRHIGIPYCG